MNDNFLESPQLSIASAVVTAAQQLSSTPSSDETAQISRVLGRALRSCEPLEFCRLSKEERKYRTQGLQISLGFYSSAQMELVNKHQDMVESKISQTLGGWGNAVQIKTSLLGEGWLTSKYPSRRGGGRRLHKYLIDDVWEKNSTAIRNFSNRSDYMRLLEPESLIFLRRIRYRLGNDHGKEDSNEAAAMFVWSTDTTYSWMDNLCGTGSRHSRQGVKDLAHYLTRQWPLGLFGVDLVDQDPNDWGAVDTEYDTLRILEVTTQGGVTAEDVKNIFDRAGQQVVVERMCVGKSDHKKPLRVFIEALMDLATHDDLERKIDVVLVHRGGGVKAPERYDANFSDKDREELFILCEKIRDKGVEVVVAIGHADASVLRGENGPEVLPIGIFEATTPTAGAAWILQEHVNNRLVDMSLSVGQPFPKTYKI